MTRVVACLVRRANHLLLCQRAPSKRHGGMWEFPGGKVEASESDAEAAARELHEELGVTVVRAAPVIFEIADAGSAYIIAFIPVEIEGEPVATEHSAMVWAPPSELVSLPLAPSDRAFLEWAADHRSEIAR